MADFNFYINRQGIQGRKGDKGDTGFSPTISVGTDTLNEYKLIIANEVNSFETPNLRGNINVLDNGGTYLRYDAETQQISAQGLDAATSTTVGGVLMSTASDIETMGDNTVITPANLADALPVYLQGEGAVTITQDAGTSKTKINVDLSSVSELSTRVSNAETAIVGLQTDVANINSDISTLNSVTANNTASISSINNNITDLNNNKVAKTDFATAETAGIVKIDGTTITSTGDGTISANFNYTLPTASTTQLGGVKVDGTTITVDENGVITSVGGGSTGDVTAAGDNTFTGANTFNGNNSFNANNSFAGWTSFANRTFFSDIITTAPVYSSKDIIYFDDFTGNWESSSGDSFSKGYGLLHIDTKQCELTTPNAESSTANLKNITLASSGDLILKANNNTIAGNISMSFIPRIKDGDGNIMLSQGNVTAGNNITIDKTDSGIKISSTASGGAAIDDANISTTTVYSSDKTVNLATSLVDNAMITLNQSKQDTLVSGTNIKTINGQSILGEGDITVGGGGVGDVTAAGNNVFTGINQFNNVITVGNSNEYTDFAKFVRDSNLQNYNQTGNILARTEIGSDAINTVFNGAPAVKCWDSTGSKRLAATMYHQDNLRSSDNISIELSQTDSRYHINLSNSFINRITDIENSIASGGGGATIDDTTASTTTTYSSSKIEKLTNVTSADSSITVTKSDTGVDIVANKAVVTGYAFPSNKFVDLTLGASNATYTAPADGWVNFSKKGTDQQAVILVNNNNKMRVQSYISSNNSNWSGIILPVKKNDTFKAEYTCTGDTMIFRFIYAEGAEGSK